MKNISENSNNKNFKVGDRVNVVGRGIGTIKNIYDSTINIKFDNTGYISVLNLDYLLDRNIITVIDDKNNKNKNIKMSNYDIEIEEEEEEEEEDDWGVFIDLTEEDIADINIENFLIEKDLKKLLSYKDIIKYEIELKKILKNKFNPVKEKINKRKLEKIKILKDYFNLLSKKYPNKKIYKISGEIQYDEIWDIRKKDRINYNKTIEELLKIDFIYYWVFKNAVIFKTK